MARSFSGSCGVWVVIVGLRREVDGQEFDFEGLQRWLFCPLLYDNLSSRLGF